MRKVNATGLGRYITADVKKQVQKNFGFGCVLCGAIPVKYDHFRKPFVECDEHDPNDIIPLCYHHEGKKEAGLIGIDQIEDAISRGKKDPSHRHEFMSPAFGIRYSNGCSLQCDEHEVRLDGQPVFQIRRTGDPNCPVELSGEFCDRHGRTVCKVRSNELVFESELLSEVKFVSNRLAVRDTSGDVIFAARLSSYTFLIDTVMAFRNNCFYVADKSGLHFGNGSRAVIIQECGLRGTETPIVVHNSRQQLKRDANGISLTPGMTLAKMVMVAEGGDSLVEVGDGYFKLGPKKRSGIGST